MGAINKVVEIGIYSENLERAERFYSVILGLKLVNKKQGRHVFLSAGRNMLLIFNPKETVRGGKGIPPHAANGPSHFAFEIEREDYGQWKNALQDHGIAIESEVEWEEYGSKSIYFRDPDNHSVELITKGFWPIRE